MLAIGTRTEPGEARGRLDFPRRDLFIWVCAIIFLNHLLFGIAREWRLASPGEFLANLGAVGIFQFMAWYAIFRLLASCDRVPIAQTRDFLIAVALCSLLLLPTVRMIWGTALGVAIYAWIFNGGDRKLRAAGIVLAALSVQQYWAPIVFQLFALSLLRAETAVVGTMLQAARAGVVWQDNIITGPSGFGIVVYDRCSSFHNLSLAMLCWLTVSNLRSMNSRAHDFVIGCIVGLTMIFCNVARLCLMAWNIDLYHYWHDGVGAQIFAVGASVTILLISLYGSSSARRAI